MSASSKGGYGGPNTSGPGGQGRDYNGNAIGSRMPGQYAVGGAPRPIGGPAPIPGGRPAPGDLYHPQPGFGDSIGMPAPAVLPPEGEPGNFRPGNRFMPGRGMIPPAGGRPGFGNPRQVNPGQGGMRPMPAQPGYGGGKGGFQGPMTMEDPRGPDGRYLNEDIVPFDNTGY